MSSDASHLEPVSHDMGRTLSPIGTPSVARLRLLIRDEVNNCLRAERGREQFSLQEEGRPGSSGRVVGRAERRRHEEDSAAALAQPVNIDKGPVERLLPILLFGFIAVIWVITIVDWLEIRMNLAWKLPEQEAPLFCAVRLVGAVAGSSVAPQPSAW
ncbi:uncharacterized protein SCHCODRAFT_02492104 [Schizophyllum commune H4-8]|uniref:Uncharacterized protein n=1 Tax=Schizophyllum commune (strain H4-8 / FGSC 9210) TaxID=578458 RepID=D8PZ17_SCHCM|nr:uncharacterized protein SCHCODRAFT_02492104 [Schizophyllum commune H4-8]KAI5896189.1 hypothetical protein SCHCODRAFT_02492104 [Schizophyllum commune H4-8]